MKKKIIVLFLLSLLSHFSIAQTLKYGIFASCQGYVKTGKLIDSPKQLFIDAILDKNTFSLGNDKKYSLYNKVEKVNGFNTTISYDAVDNKNQRCNICFFKDDTQQSFLKNMILIVYENNEIGCFFSSREPETINTK